MRRDVCYFFAADVVSVYNAYLAAAKNPPFERTCNEEPYHTFSFGVNFSFKYNMNGGSCTLHFMPCNGGSAVDLRFSIAQGAGARYGKYAKDLTERAVAILRIPAQDCQIGIEEFLKESNKVYAGSAQPQAFAPAPPPMVQPTPAMTPAPPLAPQPAPTQGTVGGGFCHKCGAATVENAAFCSACGTSLKENLHFVQIVEQRRQMVRRSAIFAVTDYSPRRVLACL